MTRSTLLPALLLVLSAVVSAVQAQQEAPPPVRPPHRILLQIEHRTADTMTSEDRTVVTAQQEALSKAVAASGYDLNGASWDYEQVLCPLFPASILLSYTSAPGSPHASRFVAVVPRDHGDAVIVPVIRNGNTPFKASASNPATISLFNQLQSQTGIDLRNPSMGLEDRWVKLALCYAELAGEHPTTLLTDTLYGEAFERNVNVPIRRVEPNGAMVLEFSDVNDPAATRQWDLAFDVKGRLTKVERMKRRLNSPTRRLQTQTDLIPTPRPDRKN